VATGDPAPAGDAAAPAGGAMPQVEQNPSWICPSQPFLTHQFPLTRCAPSSRSSSSPALLLRALLLRALSFRASYSRASDVGSARSARVRRCAIADRAASHSYGT
jgi:hypothetical protein